MSLTTIAAVKAQFNPDMGTGQDTELTAALGRVDDWLPRITGRPIEQTTFTRYFDGYGQHRCLWLPSGHYPVKHDPGVDEVAVEEDGTALTVALGYDNSTEVWIVGADATASIERTAALQRNGTWSGGYQNIKVTYKAGWPTVPEAIALLANEAVWLTFQSPTWLGKASFSQAGESATWEKDLTPASRHTLRSLVAL